MEFVLFVFLAPHEFPLSGPFSSHNPKACGQVKMDFSYALLLTEDQCMMCTIYGVICLNACIVSYGLGI